MDSLGNKGAEHVYSRTENDHASRLTPCPSGYAVIGTTTPTSTRRDAWLLRTDEAGDTLWTRTFGGEYRDAGIDIALTSDSGFIIVGYTYSFSDSPRPGAVGFGFNGGKGSIDNVLIRGKLDMQWFRDFASRGRPR